ncbi:DUF5105 domain-containing protein [Bacillus cytotoxicus]|uniref:DUF5105 domain-containing protein n=1 Tax=Bacillus cereus group sp. BfR-BA-01492 TaxID=2920361 RepID=UPI001F570836|nr:DUF5105 domain-containing protein [Bacillus cereus group sp. BfR-BA-01492]EMA6344562.1 DUF5105 domain-containing protein [Bacillus cytotoxicus]
MKIKQFMSVCFAAILTVGFVSGCSSSESATEVKENKVYEVGDTGKTQNVELKLESAEFVLPEQFTKQTNDRILKVNVSLKNKGDKVIKMLPQDFYLYQKDEKTNLYYTTDPNMLKGGDVDKGRKVSGAIYYDVKDSSSYELVYKKFVMEPKKEKEEKISFKIQGKELAKKAKELQRPAEALSAYLNAAFYDKDSDKINDLSGEDGTAFVKEVESSFKSTNDRIFNNQIDEQGLLNYFKALKTAFQKNVKFETKVISQNGDKAQVELKAKPIILNDLSSKVQSEGMTIANQNPNITEEELTKKLFDYAVQLIPEARPSDTEEIVKITMLKQGKNQWRLDTASANQIMKVFIK